ncbi:glycosyltransferase family 4 protein [Bacillus spongiae]|uniref:Glycosyltransferase family 4 protein n=1 Tax=Bacillus spongiae TaxID=2683610 RepID=A0ABU8HJQ6_9BACI
MSELLFPYPYVISALDHYYNVTPPLSEKDYNQKPSGGSGGKKKRSSKKQLSILIATFWDYPHTGGLSNYITSLRDGLIEMGHKVDVISPNQFPQEKVAALRKEIVPKLKNFLTNRYGEYSKKILQSTRLLYIYEQMLMKMDLDQYDIFHAQDLFTANILGRFNAKYNKPLLFTPHGMFTFNRIKFNRIEKGSVEEIYYETIERKAIKYADHLIVISDSFHKPLKDMGAKAKKLTTIYTGIDFPAVQRKKNKKIIISSISRLGPRKGHNDLLKALSKIKKHTKHVEVLIVGDGEMRTTLEEMKESLHLDNVRILGKRDDIANILSHTDIFVLPTLNDNLPVSIIEAMHSRTAVITTNCGGIPELIEHDKTGIIIEPKDIKALSKQLKRLILEKDTRAKLAQNAYDYAQKQLTRDMMVNQISEKYQQLLASKEEERNE